jgi:hypothetical protein
VAVTVLRVQIGQLSGCPRQLDTDELGRRVAADLAELLARAPLSNLPAPGTVIRVPPGRVHAADADTPASLAHAVARHVYTALQTGVPCPR